MCYNILNNDLEVVMKRSIKLLFGILTAVIITVCMLCLCVSAESDEKISASGYFGELNWRFSKDSATLTISGEGRMLAPPMYDYWYTYAPFVRYVIIEDGAENISGDILSHCNMLDWVSIPDSVNDIDENALYVSDLLIIKCNYGSYAASYAEDNGIKVEYLDFSYPAFTENGLQLKIVNLTGVKLIRVAYGDYDTIGQISRAEGERSFTARDVLKDRNGYTLQFREEGLVTVAVLYNNGYIEYYKYDVIKNEPTVTRDGGNNITFGNLNDLKVLRYVKGEYDSSYDIKRAEGSVAVSGKTLNSDTYTATLDRETYTFCVQYNDESYNYYVTGVCGDNLTWVYDMQTCTLTISGEGEMYNYNSGNYRPWDNYISEIKTIVVKTGVTSIGHIAFGKCNNLNNISLPFTINTKTKLGTCIIRNGTKAISSCAFEDAVADVIYIPESVEFIGSGGLAVYNHNSSLYDEVLFKVVRGSYAEQYLMQTDYNFSYFDPAEIYG